MAGLFVRSEGIIVFLQFGVNLFPLGRNGPGHASKTNPVARLFLFFHHFGAFILEKDI